MADAKRDNNRVTTLLAVSNADGVTPVVLWADPTTHRLLVDLPAGSGTVTSVSVVTANGVSGTVATATTTPAITLTLGAITPSAVQVSGLTASQIVGTDASKNIVSLAVATYPSLTELTYVKGVTSAIQTQMDLKAPLASPALTGTPTAPTAAPATNNTQVATTAYVDAAVLGQNFKEAAKWATTAALPANTYSNGASGVGATLTAVATGVLTIDGNTVALNDRVLVKNEVAGANNGLYLCTVAGAVGVAYVLTRATDSDTSVKWKTGDSAFITSGSTLSTTTWAYTGIDSPTIGTTALTFAQTAGQGSFTAGNGIAITGVSIAIDTAVTVDKTTAQTLTNKTLTSPTLTTPSLGVATATSVNKVVITAPATSATLTIADGKTLTANNSLTLAGTDTTTMTFPTTSATVARTDAGQTFTGTQVMTSPKILTSLLDTNGNAYLSQTATASAVNYVNITNAATGTAGPIIQAAGETNIDLKLAGKGTGAVHHTSGVYGDITADTDGATITFDLSVSNIHSVTLGGNRTLAVSNGKTGQTFMLRLKQDATGSRTVTWFTTVAWQGGSAPTLTTAANKTDTLGFIVTSAGNYAGYVVGQNE